MKTPHMPALYNTAAQLNTPFPPLYTKTAHLNTTYPSTLYNSSSIKASLIPALYYTVAQLKQNLSQPSRPQQLN